MPLLPTFETNPELKQEILKLFQHGLPIADVMELVSMEEKLFYVWQRKANDGEEPYATFLHDIRKARKLGRLKAVATIHKAMENKEDVTTSIKVAQWYLERQDPDNWGRRSKKTIDININEGLLAKIVMRCNQLGLNPDEVMQRMLDRLEEQLEPGKLADGTD